MGLLFEPSQIPYLNDAIITSRCNEWILFVPRYNVDVTVVCPGGDHAGFVRGSPTVPYPNGLVHRTGRKDLHDYKRLLLQYHVNFHINNP